MYANGEGVPENDAEAVRWYRLAAEQGHATAQSNLGVMHAKGEGVLKDNAEAVRWYRLAAEQGVASAQFNLGVMYDNGEGVLKDDAEAVRWYRLGCRAGSPDSPVQPRSHVRQRRGRSQGFCACAHVVQHRCANGTQAPGSCGQS